MVAGAFFLLLTMVLPGVASGTPVHLRVNQVGFLPGDGKGAWALTSENLKGQNFQIVVAGGGNVVFTGPVGTDRGPYGNFAHLYELHFHGLATPGRYRLRLGSDLSPPFPRRR